MGKGDKERAYFGHPINIYGTEQESNLIKIIEQKFPNLIVENPGEPHHGKNYQEWKQKTGNGMEYFFQKVLPNMDVGVFLPFDDGMFGAGVFKEAEFLLKQKKPVYEITFSGEISELNSLDSSRKLSIDETRGRVYGK